MSGMPPYADNREHLAAELAWLDLALGTLVGAGPPDGDPLASVGAARQTIQQRLDATALEGRLLVLPLLTRLFGLSPQEEILIVCCLAPELDPASAATYAHLANDPSRACPSLSLVHRLSSLDPRCSDVATLTSDSRTAAFRWQLVRLDGSRDHRCTQGVVLDPGVSGLLTGAGWLDDRVDALLRPLPPVVAPQPGQVDDAVEDRVTAWPYEQAAGRLALQLRDSDARVLGHFHGAAASEGRRIAAAACSQVGAGLLHADLAEVTALARSGEEPFADSLRRIYRQAALVSAGVYLSGLDDVRRDPRAPALLHTLEELIREASWFTCLESQSPWVPSGWYASELVLMPFDLPMPSFSERRDAWSRSVAGLPDDEAADLASRFPLTVTGITEAVQLARARATAGGDDWDGNTDVGADAGRFAHLVWGCQQHARTGLDGLAAPISPRAGWPDLVLASDVLEQLHELCGQVRQRGRVLDEWGLGDRGSAGNGVRALFLGPSGTGKTLAAEVVAGSLGMDLLKVDLSSVVSKYVGETEKHLARVFSAAERSGAVLFIDEADALFGKRSEVRDSHDRYANIEISFLLQRLEEYDGVVILASNLGQSIDSAFLRRIRVIVQFPFPDEQARRAIWDRHLPARLPVDDDLDLAQLARHVKVSGGVIDKIVWNAAFLAASDGGRLRQEHVLRATRREYDRMGKPFDPTPMRQRDVHEAAGR